MNTMQATRASEPDWSGWEKWLRSHLDIEREFMIEAFGEALGITCQELRDRISALELKLAELTGAIDILRGLQPPPPAKLQTIRAWKPDTIYHEGAIVAFAGGTWQAQRDTGKAPGTKDWVALAVAGRDGRMPRVRGTYSADATYQALDLVMRESSSFIATRDDPGPCPGNGWQMIACGGKRGAAGEKGERGPKGDAGASGVTIRGWKIDRTRYVATPVMSDGSDGPPLELRGLFEQFFSEVR